MNRLKFSTLAFYTQAYLKLQCVKKNRNIYAMLEGSKGEEITNTIPLLQFCQG